MNAHDPKRLLAHCSSRVTRQVESEADAKLILYNTAPFATRPRRRYLTGSMTTRNLHKAGKRFAVLACVAQQEGENNKPSL